MLFTIILIVLIIGVFALLVGRKEYFRYEADGILIHGSVNQKVLYSSILEMRRISLAELGTAMKLGTRMPGTMHGLFHFPQLGQVFVCVNNDRNMVLIRTTDAQYIISPDNPEQFMERIRK